MTSPRAKCEKRLNNKARDNACDDIVVSALLKPHKNIIIHVNVASYDVIMIMSVIMILSLLVLMGT